MNNRMIRGLNGYVLSPFGDTVDFNDPAYGWGGVGATSVPSAPSTGFDVNNLVSTLGTVAGGILNIFAPKSPIPTATAGAAATGPSIADQLAMQRAQAEAESAKRMPLYIGGGIAALVLLVVVLKK